MTNKEYWRGRFSILEEAAHRDSAACYQTLEREYRRASQSIQTDIEKWYARFAKNNGISLLEAKKQLTLGQLEEFKWTVEEYIKAGESLDPKWAKQLENASARVHISRLESLQLQVQQQIEVLFGYQVDGLDRLLRQVYSNGYYHTAFEIQKGLHIGWDLQSLNEKQLQMVLTKPWSTDERTFRDRCWLDKVQLVNTVQSELIHGIIRGVGPDKAVKTIVDRLHVSKNKAGRLVMTESAYISAQSQKDCFQALDVKRYEIVATLDGNTCAICGGLDGMVFPMSDYEPGVTANPFHPWCRCCTAPYFEDDDGERAARNAEGKTYYVPGNMKYTEWKQQHVKNIEAEKAASVVKDASNEFRALGSVGLLRLPSLDKFTEMKYNNSPDYQKLIARYQNLTGERAWSAVEFNPETIADHADRHGKDFGLTNQAEYGKKAVSFINGKQKDKQSLVGSDGVRRFYSEADNTFAAVYPDGTISTFYRPRQGNRYWERQVKKYGEKGTE